MTGIKKHGGRKDNGKLYLWNDDCRERTAARLRRLRRLWREDLTKLIEKDINSLLEVAVFDDPKTIDELRAHEFKKQWNRR